MSMLHQSILKGSLTIMLACCFSGCDRKEEVVERSLGLEAFIPQYNRYIKDWLATEKAGFEMIIEESAITQLCFPQPPASCTDTSKAINGKGRDLRSAA